MFFVMFKDSTEKNKCYKNHISVTTIDMNAFREFVYSDAKQSNI